jgi:hypothetical protein
MSGATRIALTTKTPYELPGLFASAAKSGAAGSTTPQVAVVAASQQRTVDSGSTYVAALEKAVPALAPVVGAATTDNDLLYFHKAAVNQDYQDYVASDPRLKAAEAAALDSPASHAQATALLERSFTPAFVKQLAAGPTRPSSPARSTRPAPCTRCGPSPRTRPTRATGRWTNT